MRNFNNVSLYYTILKFIIIFIEVTLSNSGK